MGAQRILLRQIARLHPARRHARQFRCAALHAGDFQQSLLGGQQVVVSRQGRLHLLGLHILDIGQGRIRRALRSLGAQRPLAATLPGPVQPDGLVHALARPGITSPHSVLQIDGSGLGTEHRQWCMVGRGDIGARCAQRMARQQHIAVVTGHRQGLPQRQRRRGGRSALCPAGQRTGQGREKNQLSYAHALFIAAVS